MDWSQNWIFPGLQTQFLIDSRWIHTNFCQTRFSHYPPGRNEDVDCSHTLLHCFETPVKFWLKSFFRTLNSLDSQRNSKGKVHWNAKSNVLDGEVRETFSWCICVWKQVGPIPSSSRWWEVPNLFFDFRVFGPSFENNT